jgi:hypothetical protein
MMKCRNCHAIYPTPQTSAYAASPSAVASPPGGGLAAKEKQPLSPSVEKPSPGPASLTPPDASPSGAPVPARLPRRLVAGVLAVSSLLLARLAFGARALFHSPAPIDEPGREPVTPQEPRREEPPARKPDLSDLEFLPDNARALLSFRPAQAARQKGGSVDVLPAADGAGRVVHAPRPRRRRRQGPARRGDPAGAASQLPSWTDPLDVVVPDDAAAVRKTVLPDLGLFGNVPFPVVTFDGSVCLLKRDVSGEEFLRLARLPGVAKDR